MKVEVSHRDSIPPVVTLEEAATLDPARLGAKAANLALLAGAGFPVPPGLVVTPDAEGRRGETQPRLLETAAGLGAERFAVRSSGTTEDLEGASFAGQYETLLEVPIEGLPAAVEKVFDSASASRVTAYREARGKTAGGIGRPRLAVLVQAMVEADAAGWPGRCSSAPRTPAGDERLAVLFVPAYGRSPIPAFARKSLSVAPGSNAK